MSGRTFEQLTERERLELAAKAAGLEVKAVIVFADGTLKGLDVSDGVNVIHYWHPLADDGDALRLAMAIPSLNLQWVIAEAYQAADTEALRLDYVRRAIFRVAVEFGLRMTPDLPEGFRMIDGEVHAVCCCCEQWKPLPVGLDEIGDPENYQHHCGGSPRCCP